MYRIFFLSATLVLMQACGQPAAETAGEETGDSPGTTVVKLNPAQVKNAGIVTAAAEKGKLASVLQVNGKIDVPPQNFITVSVPMGGYLRNTRLLPGMPVKKGEEIARLEDQQYIQLQQDYLTAKAGLAYTEKEFRRQQELNATKVSSDKDFEQAKAVYTKSLVELKALSEKLFLLGIDPQRLNENNISRSIRILSPINGFVSSVNVNNGKYITPSDVMFELVDPSDIHLTLTVYEKDLGRVFVGQEVEAWTNHQPEKKYRGKIILVGQSISADRTVEVHCHFDTRDQSLVPGMYMNAGIQSPNPDADVLPEEAVVSHNGHQYVFVQQNTGQYEMVPVQTLETQNGRVSVKGLEKLAGHRFVVKGAYTLLMSLKNREE